MSRRTRRMVQGRRDRLPDRDHDGAQRPGRPRLPAPVPGKPGARTNGGPDGDGTERHGAGSGERQAQELAAGVRGRQRGRAGHRCGTAARDGRQARLAGSDASAVRRVRRARQALRLCRHRAGGAPSGRDRHRPAARQDRAQRRAAGPAPHLRRARPAAGTISPARKLSSCPTPARRRKRASATAPSSATHIEQRGQLNSETIAKWRSDPALS
ncbi:hypothetical protein LP419_30740 [Massilia sp. H-1]|nr:hypothetical protein LP419_30740 [Massilia sp. H-1]